jgi:fructose-1,6-bisphosphatase-3
MNTDERYLNLLSRSFPTVASAATEVINLEAILNLPKGTEHFLADIHGEHEAFIHVLKNASGNIKRKVNDIFGNTIRESEKKELCTLIYYPEKKLELIKEQESDIDDWYRITIHQLVRVCRDVSSKYTRSKVRKALPEDFAYIIEELLHESTDDHNKAAYVNVIISTIISTGRADDFICAIAGVIQRLAIDQLHILGDIFDRGTGAHIILDTLAQYHKWDITWGNHDILWMGAAAGNDACICNVIRLSLRYANMRTLEDGYGISLLPLATWAMEQYDDDECTGFAPITSGGARELDEKTSRLMAQMHKAISILQFKFEAETYRRHPQWQMQERAELYSTGFSLEISPEERELMKKLHHSFRVSEKLQSHMRLLLRHGSMYNICNGNLMFHASIPLNNDGTLREVLDMGAGKELFENIETAIRTAFQPDGDPHERQSAIDFFLYLWCGPNSPLFDKSKMATYERYFLSDRETWKEEKGNYFRLRDEREVMEHIMDAFGISDEPRHIINGHVPVHAAEGENPIKADGRLMVIDGGFSQAYHKTTGIAGYTLVYHSRGFELVQHEPFLSVTDAIRRGTDIKSTRQIVEMANHRMLVADTDKGHDLSRQIRDLQHLLYAYRHGYIKEKERKE